MRSTIALGFAFVLAAGCSGPLVDDTPNQMPNAVNYPKGPYGYVQGSTIQNIHFVGKNEMGDQNAGAYSGISMMPVQLADFYNDSSTKYVALSGVAGWCSPCNQEQAEVPNLQAKYEPMGVKFFEAMMQGYNEQTGAPATENDINRWQTAHHLEVGIGTDPGNEIFQYADLSAFPVNMVIRTRDMSIVYMNVGYDPNLDGTLSNVISQNP